MKVRDAHYYVGLDLGQKHSFTAIAVVERSVEKEEVRDSICWTLDWVEDEPQFAVRHLERVRLGTPYLEVVAKVRAMLDSDKLRGKASLLVDATGLGTPVAELFADAGLRPPVMTPVVITSGGKESAGKGAERLVPKQDLLTGLVVMLEEKKLAIARGLPEAKVLVEELVQLGREGVGSRGGGSAAACGDRDDLAMALALACWGAKKGGPPKGKSAKEKRAANEFVEMLFGVAAHRCR